MPTASGRAARAKNLASAQHRRTVTLTEALEHEAWCKESQAFIDAKLGGRTMMAKDALMSIEAANKEGMLSDTRPSRSGELNSLP